MIKQVNNFIYLGKNFTTEIVDYTKSLQEEFNSLIGKIKINFVRNRISKKKTKKTSKLFNQRIFNRC